MIFSYYGVVRTPEAVRAGLSRSMAHIKHIARHVLLEVGEVLQEANYYFGSRNGVLFTVR